MCLQLNCSFLRLHCYNVTNYPCEKSSINCGQFYLIAKPLNLERIASWSIAYIHGWKAMNRDTSCFWDVMWPHGRKTTPLIIHNKTPLIKKNNKKKTGAISHYQWIHHNSNILKITTWEEKKKKAADRGSSADLSLDLAPDQGSGAHSTSSAK